MSSPPASEGSQSALCTGSIPRMKKLIVLAAIVGIAAIIYKVLTTEVPIDE